MISKTSYKNLMNSHLTFKKSLVSSLLLAPVFLILAGCGPSIEEVKQEEEKAALTDLATKVLSGEVTQEVSAGHDEHADKSEPSESEDANSEAEVAEVGHESHVNDHKGSVEEEHQEAESHASYNKLDESDRTPEEDAQHQQDLAAENTDSEIKAEMVVSDDETDSVADTAEQTAELVTEEAAAVNEEKAEDVLESSEAEVVAVENDQVAMVSVEDAQANALEEPAILALAAENPNDSALRQELMAAKQAKEGADLALASKMAEIRALETLLSNAEDKIAQMSNELEAVRGNNQTEQNTLLDSKRTELMDKLQASREMRESLSRQSDRTQEAVDRASEVASEFSSEIEEVEQKITTITEQ